jgi:hypothetical protein
MSVTYWELPTPTNSFTGIINKVKLLDQQIIFTLFLPVAFSDPDPT